VTTAVLSAETVRQALRLVKDPELDMKSSTSGWSTTSRWTTASAYQHDVDLTRCPAGPMITKRHLQKPSVRSRV